MGRAPTTVKTDPAIIATAPIVSSVAELMHRGLVSCTDRTPIAEVAQARGVQLGVIVDAFLAVAVPAVAAVLLLLAGSRYLVPRPAAPLATTATPTASAVPATVPADEPAADDDEMRAGHELGPEHARVGQCGKGLGSVTHGTGHHG